MAKVAHFFYLFLKWHVGVSNRVTIQYGSNLFTSTADLHLWACVNNSMDELINQSPK